MNERLLTARQVGDMLGVTSETVLRWTRAGELPAIRLPGTARGRLRYRPDDVDAWVDQHATAATAGREVLPTQPDRGRRGPAYATVRSCSLPTPPPQAATTEEDT